MNLLAIASLAASLPYAQALNLEAQVAPTEAYCNITNEDVTVRYKARD